MGDYKNNIMEQIHSENLDMWRWLGDAYYSDPLGTEQAVYWGLREDGYESFYYTKEKIREIEEDPFYTKIKEKAKIVGM